MGTLTVIPRRSPRVSLMNEAPKEEKVSVEDVKEERAEKEPEGRF